MKIAVLLSGCGFLDGAEIRESVFSMLALDKKDAEISFFAPNKATHHTINHLKGEEQGNPRNILEEAARIARMKVTDLEELNADEFDGVVIPGGFGVAKNFCSFAFKGGAGEVNPIVSKVITNFHSQKKPIGAICIAPALVSMTLGSFGVNVTIGNDPETASEIEKTGAKHTNCNVDEICIDENNKVVSTPAYMYDEARLKDIYTGIEKCVDQVISWAK